MNTSSKIEEIIYEIETSNIKGQELLKLTDEMFEKMKAIEKVEREIEQNNLAKPAPEIKEYEEKIKESIVNYLSFNILNICYRKKNLNIPDLKNKIESLDEIQKELNQIKQTILETKRIQGKFCL